MADTLPHSRVPLRDLDVADVAIGPGTKITLHFSLKLDYDQIVDSNFDKQPAIFVFGDGNILPGFERALVGKQAGEAVEAVIAAADAFGLVNPDNQQRFPHYQFPPDLALSENLLVEFTDASGYQQAGRVTAIGKQYVDIDFNHPLAGRDILFSAVILAVELSS